MLKRLILSNINLTLSDNEDCLKTKIAKELRVKECEISGFTVIKKAVDARKKNNILFTYSILVDLTCNKDFSWNKNVKKAEFCENYEIPRISFKKRPVIVGFGPAGMFAALVLARAGARPVILERGKRVEEREEDVKRFRERGIFSETSNVCFGEGGAGTFSDGKLTTGINDPRIRFVLSEFIKAGAPNEIYYEAHPHVGSDNLRKIVKNIREEIIGLGGDVLFEHTFTGFETEDNHLTKVLVSTKNGEMLQFETDDLVLAIGHSARDTFEMLYGNNVLMEPKPFSVGVRVEMNQERLSRDQYGENYKNPKLGPAEYKVAEHLSGGRSVYSFCMCPGGTVVGSNTEENTVLVNGMSYFKRDLENANSALLVNVDVDDYYKSSPLDGIYFQREIERKAFSKEHPYMAPVQLVGDFLAYRKSTGFGEIKPTYEPGTYFAEMDDILPGFVCDALREAIPKLSKRLHSLAIFDNILTAAETRSSSPVKIPRDENGDSSVKGIYPCGEGASYAGGIMSAAIDGLRVCEFIKNKYLEEYYG